MENLKNTYYVFQFEDGNSVNMTLAFYLLYKLKNFNRGLYDRYNKVMTKGANEELDMITVLYAAYVCANIDSPSLLSEEDFMIRCGSDRHAVKVAMEHLTKAKK